MISNRAFVCIALSFALSASLSVPSFAQFNNFQVTVSNLTPTISFDASGANTPPKAPNFRPKNDFSSQPFTSPVFATHDGSYVMWRFGTPATPQIRLIAEDGFNKKPGNFADTGYIVGSLMQQQASRSVLNFKEIPNPKFNPTNQFANSGGDVVPGSIPFPLTNWLPSQSSESFQIADDATHHFLSGAFMLIRTNDAFTGLDSIDLNLISTSGTTFDVFAYDSGTEKNTEAHDDLVYFDSPPSGHTPEDVDTNIHLHSGITGGAGSILTPYAWNNRLPVARITITAVPEPGVFSLLLAGLGVGGTLLGRGRIHSRRPKA